MVELLRCLNLSSLDDETGESDKEVLKHQKEYKKKGTGWLSLFTSLQGFITEVETQMVTHAHFILNSLTSNSGGASGLSSLSGAAAGALTVNVMHSPANGVTHTSNGSPTSSGDDKSHGSPFAAAVANSSAQKTLREELRSHGGYSNFLSSTKLDHMLAAVPKELEPIMRAQPVLADELRRARSPSSMGGHINSGAGGPPSTRAAGHNKLHSLHALPSAALLAGTGANGTTTTASAVEFASQPASRSASPNGVGPDLQSRVIAAPNSNSSLSSLNNSSSAKSTPPSSTAGNKKPLGAGAAAANGTANGSANGTANGTATSSGAVATGAVSANGSASGSVTPVPPPVTTSPAKTAAERAARRATHDGSSNPLPVRRISSITKQNSHIGLLSPSAKDAHAKAMAAGAASGAGAGGGGGDTEKQSENGSGAPLHHPKGSTAARPRIAASRR